ncbi:MAG TPA: rubrerythrin [Bdellovibrionales bacterium]|nr:MAG: rubrerythrin [Bdellovibrionales bacterium GWB1_52_6]OFZ03175.1 MAG: rubrerythrin [Bdellovibrionales bacterium GWA1_52_35]OFZ35194.1 MAG: rubrerythrin [Bdellovibrionales bacterium GWC1_52_8]HAR42537.1 rubrerythrin [Bdellovibrionales bacterium]HCM38331.1 rubrerythrin [Bdellovibrionales bacterium]
MTSKIDFLNLSLQDALDLAILIEKEAEERYQEFTEMLGGRYTGDATEFFETMARNEAKHGDQLKDRREKLFKNAPSQVHRDMISDVEAPDYGKPRSYMSPHQAMKVAIECEAKAYSFFVEALKSVKNEEVKALFTELRDEETLHQQMISEQLKKLPKDDGTPDKSDDDLDEPPAL